MPTTRPRHTITETDELAAMLDDAARRWPEDAASRARLLVRLAELGAGADRVEREQRLAKRRALVDRAAAGEFAGMFPPGYLEELRRDWPE